MFFWNSLAFSMIQQMLAIWSLVPLPFLKPAQTSGISWVTYSWSLAWRILSITLLLKGLALVILTCFFLSSVELAGKNVKALPVLERSVRKHKAFCICAQKITYKVTIDICSRIFAKNVPGWAPGPQLEAMGKIVIWDLLVREMFMAKEVCWV